MSAKRKPLDPVIVAALIKYEGIRLQALATKQLSDQDDYDSSRRVKNILDEYRKAVADNNNMRCV